VQRPRLAHDRADRREGEREEEQHGLLFAKTGAERDVDKAVGGLGFEGEVGGFGAN
jgi:hypothetical protein